MKEKIMREARAHAEAAKKIKNPKILTVKGGETSSLAKVIKTKEQADFFMKLLRSL